MSIDKEKIAKRFNAASGTYDQVASVQKECASHLVRKLHEFINTASPKSILDLGTGTGYMPELLMRLYPDAHFDLNDIAVSMLDYVKNKFGSEQKFNYLLCDFENLEVKPYDLIISNLALQWTDSFHATLKNFFQNSNFFAFSCLLEGTMSEWGKKFERLQLPIPTYDYPSAEELEISLREFNPKTCLFDVKKFTLVFDGAVEFIQYLNKLGGSSASKTVSSSDIKKIIALNAHPFEITYNVFFALLERG